MDFHPCGVNAIQAAPKITLATVNGLHFASTGIRYTDTDTDTDTDTGNDADSSNTKKQQIASLCMHNEGECD